MQTAATRRVEQAIQSALADESSSQTSLQDDIPTVVEKAIQQALVDESATELRIEGGSNDHLTVNDAQRIIECLRQTPRVDTLTIWHYSLHDDAALNILRDGLPLCTSITTVKLVNTHLTNEGLDRLRPAFCNTSVTKLSLSWGNDIQGQRGGEVLRDLLVGNDTLRELILWGLSGNSHFGPEVAIGFGQGLAVNRRLRILNLESCHISNDFLANLLAADGMINNSLLHLNLGLNGIEGEAGGRQVNLLLQRCPVLKVLWLNGNNLGPLGARALAPGLAASRLESLSLYQCGLGNDGMANLIPEGQENRSLTNLDLRLNGIQGEDGGENVIVLASRCTNLDSIVVYSHELNPGRRRRLDLLLDRKRLCTEASALGGSTFPVLFRFVEKAHHHEHGLSAIFVILQNDGDDYFCIALNRGAID